MQQICTHACQFRGVLVQPDTVLDITDEEAKSDLVKSSFRRLDGGPKAKAEEQPDERGMTAQNYRDALDARNVPYHRTDDIAALRKLFDRSNDIGARRGGK